MPDLHRSRRRDWGWALGDACQRVPAADIGDGAAGAAPRRDVLAGYLQRVRAGSSTPEHGGGGRLPPRAARRPPRPRRAGVTRVGLEDPGPSDSDVIARRHGLEAVPVPVDGEGVDVEALRAPGPAPCW